MPVSSLAGRAFWIAVGIASWLPFGVLLTSALAKPSQMPGSSTITCPGDQVVWVNTRTGIYHLRGERWFGRTKQGAYECEKAADAEGDRETRNGQ